MGQGYSLDLRERVVGAVEAGASRRAAARQFSVSASSAIKWVDRVEETGSVAPSPRSKTYKSRLNEQKAWLLSVIEVEPGLTLEEIRERLAGREVNVCTAAIWRFFDRNGISFKKNRTRRRTRPARRSKRT